QRARRQRHGQQVLSHRSTPSLVTRFRRTPPGDVRISFSSKQSGRPVKCRAARSIASRIVYVGAPGDEISNGLRGDKDRRKERARGVPRLLRKAGSRRAGGVSEQLPVPSSQSSRRVFAGNWQLGTGNCSKTGG